MQVDSLKYLSSSWHNQLFDLSNIISFIALGFSFYAFRKSNKLDRPLFTYCSFINYSYFVAKVASSYNGIIPIPKFYFAKIYLGFLPLKWYKLEAYLRDSQKEDVRPGSEIPRVVFKGEQLFWLIPPDNLELSKAKYKIYAKTKVGWCSATYCHPDDNLPLLSLTKETKEQLIL